MTSNPLEGLPIKSNVRRQTAVPGHPRIDKGEGLIRSHDLLEILRADIDAAYSALETDRASQYLRRCLVRAVFSYIEAVVECVKVELRSTVRTDLYPEASLTLKAREALDPLAVISAPSGKFLPLDQNLKRTFKLAAKILASQLQSCDQWGELQGLSRRQVSAQSLDAPAYVLRC